LREALTARGCIACHAHVAVDGVCLKGHVAGNPGFRVRVCIVSPAAEQLGAAVIHSALGPGIPEPPQARIPASVHRHKLPVGYRLVSKAILGGLHHEYGLEKEAA